LSNRVQVTERCIRHVSIINLETQGCKEPNTLGFMSQRVLNFSCELDGTLRRTGADTRCLAFVRWCAVVFTKSVSLSYTVNSGSAGRSVCRHNTNPSPKTQNTRYRNTRQEVSDYQSVLFYFCFIFYVIYYCLNLNNIPYYIPFFYSPSFFHFLLFCKY